MVSSCETVRCHLHVKAFPCLMTLSSMYDRGRSVSVSFLKTGSAACRNDKGEGVDCVLQLDEGDWYVQIHVCHSQNGLGIH